jgi:hypothetical protein
MPIEVNWDNDEKTTVRYTFSGHWTWDELHASLTHERALRQTVDHTVHTIADLLDSTSVPTDAIVQLKGTFDYLPANVGLIVVVSRDSFLITMYQIFAKVFRKYTKRLLVVASLAEARALLAEHAQDWPQISNL